MSRPQDSSGILDQDAGAPQAEVPVPTQFRWRNATPSIISAGSAHASLESTSSGFIGPKRRVGRPPKPVLQDKQPVGRPPKAQSWEGAKDIFKRMGKFVVPGTNASRSAHPVAPIFLSPSRAPQSNQPSPESNLTGPADATALPTQAPAPQDASPTSAHPSTAINIIADEDSSRPIHHVADNEGGDDSDNDDDGTGIGEEDDDSDDDDDIEGEDGTGDGEDGKDGSGMKSKGKRKFLRPMPPWLEKVFKKHVTDSAVRDSNGRPPLYSSSNSFFFPRPSTFFLLRDGVTPDKLYNPLFMLWDPEALCDIPCPNCTRSLTRHSVVPRPRRVVDMDSCFWIIGYRYRCRECVNPKTGRRGTLTFRSWNPAILAKLPSYVAEEFPAVLTHRSGISKTVLHTLRSAINSGMGPKKFSDTLRSQHLLRYDTLHIQYLEFIGDRPLDTWRGEKYDAFLPFHDRSPEGPHGYIPSASYLRDIYDNFIEQHREEMNQHMAMRSCRVGAIDHSHKFPKHIAQVNGERVFTGLLTVTNELGEIRLCVLVATKAHSAFEYALVLLRESLRLYGHEQPQLFYTDNMSDRNLLESAFPSLREGVTPVEEYSHLPVFSLPATVRMDVYQTPSAINAALSPVVDDIPTDDSMPDLVIGLDAEWNVEMTDIGAFIRGEIAVLQIAYQNRVYILQISEMISRGQLPDMLVMLLGNPRVVKVGRLVNSDLRQLQDCTKRAQPFPGALDLGKFAKDRCVVSSAKCSLGDLCASVLGTRLNKNVSERTCSAWERSKLTDEQIRYAACDAYASLLIYETLQKLSIPQKLCEPLIPSTPVLLYNADSTKIIARGRLASPNVHPDLFDDIKLRTTHVLVEILEVYVPGAIITSHKKRALETFGSVPFHLVYLQSRARSYDPITTNLPSFSPAGLSVVEAMAQSEPLQDVTAEEDLEQLPLDDSEAHDAPTDPDNIDTTAGILRQIDRLEDDVIDQSEMSVPSLRFETDKESEAQGQSLLSSLRASPWPTVIRSRVIKDVFHVFNMLQLSTTHALRKEFAVVLRDALLIPDNEDRARISQYGATLNPPQSFEQLRASRSSWVWKRCRRVIPPPEELYSHVEQVFSTYGPLKDEKTKKPLFSPHNWRAAVQILQLVRNGSLSDPPNFALYSIIGVDAKCGNLPIYRCFRGTNATEGGVHTHLRSNLPSSGASFRHTDSCVADFVLHKNLAVGTFNSTGQKFRSHAYIWVTNRLQELLITLEDRLVKPTHIAGWVNGNLYVQTKECTGIIAIPRELQEQSGMSPFNKNLDGGPKKRHAYLARKQNTRKAILPVHTPTEHRLFSHFMRDNEAYASRASGPRWSECVRVWNTHADTDDDVFYKLSEQLSAYYKSFIARLNVKHTKAVTLMARKPVNEAVQSLKRAQQAPPVPVLTLDGSSKVPSTGFVRPIVRSLAAGYSQPVSSVRSMVQPTSHQVGNTSTASGQGITSTHNTPSSSSSSTQYHVVLAPPTHTDEPQPESTLQSGATSGPSGSDDQTREAIELLSRQRVADMVQARRATKKPRKPPSCRRCGSAQCKGKRGNLEECHNPCQDCGKIGQCRGRNLQSNPKRPCFEAWPETTSIG